MSIGLVHYPIYNKNNEIVTTAANFDIHDIARTARTYNISTLYYSSACYSTRSLVGKVLNIIGKKVWQYL